jgi:hypothetical protein
MPRTGGGPQLSAALDAADEQDLRRTHKVSLEAAFQKQDRTAAIDGSLLALFKDSAASFLGRANLGPDRPLAVGDPRPLRGRGGSCWGMQVPVACTEGQARALHSLADVSGCLPLPLGDHTLRVQLRCEGLSHAVSSTRRADLLITGAPLSLSGLSEERFNAVLGRAGLAQARASALKLPNGLHAAGKYAVTAVIAADLPRKGKIIFRLESGQVLGAATFEVQLPELPRVAALRAAWSSSTNQPPPAAPKRRRRRGGRNRRPGQQQPPPGGGGAAGREDQSTADVGTSGQAAQPVSAMTVTGRAGPQKRPAEQSASLQTTPYRVAASVDRAVSSMLTPERAALAERLTALGSLSGVGIGAGVGAGPVVPVASTGAGSLRGKKPHLFGSHPVVDAG